MVGVLGRMQPRRPSCVAHTSHARWHRQIADVCVVSSIRDGMNLVSHEFVACQDEESPGVLVLRWGKAVSGRSAWGPTLTPCLPVCCCSEFAGIAQCLSGAIRVNPWATDDLAGAMNAVRPTLV